MIPRDLKRWGSHLIVKIVCFGLFDKITGEFQKMGNHSIRQIAEIWKTRSIEKRANQALKEL